MVTLPDDAWRNFALCVTAVSTLRNRQDPTRLGGFESAEKARAHLVADCALDNREATLERLAFLFQKGHSALWVELRAMLRQIPEQHPTANIRFSTDTSEPFLWTETHDQIDLIRVNPDVGNVALVAWDMGRMLSIAAWAHIAGFLTDEELERWSVRGCLRVRRSYESWKAFGNHHRLGCEFWRRGSSAGDDATYSWLNEDPESPWQRHAFECRLYATDAVDGTRVKQVKCDRCGAKKQRQSESAYVYCDACGSLTDLDIAIALARSAEHPPGPVYERLLERHQVRLDAALARQDRDAYTESQAKLYDEYVHECPESVPLRCKDPGYRQRFVDFHAACATSREFSERCRELRKSLELASRELTTTSTGKTRFLPTVFWAVASWCAAYMEACLEQNAADGLIDRHPDGASRALLQKIGFSTFALGWLPYLAEEDRDYFLEVTGLALDYAPAVAVACTERTCSSCAVSFTVLQGNRSYPCPECGMQTHAERSLVCGDCGAVVGIGASDRFVQCPYCRTSNRVV